MTDNKSELKPCPFCGEENIKHSESGFGGFSEYWIECQECEVVITRSTKQQAVEAWNTRTEHSKQSDGDRETVTIPVWLYHHYENGMKRLIELDPNIWEARISTLIQIKPDIPTSPPQPIEAKK